MQIRSASVAAGLALLTAAFGSSLKAATAPTSRVADQLEDVRWLFLPVGVQDVFVGPDQRTWYGIDSRRGIAAADLEREIEELKRNIEAEYLQKTPQVRARVILFEPKGRVWFTVLRRLMGYDGRRWVEKELPPDVSPGWGWGTHLGQLGTDVSGVDELSTAAVAAGELAFFVCGSDVFWFDGDDWHRQTIEEKAYTALLSEPDGKGVIAIGRFLHSSPRTGAVIWRWRDRSWRRLEADPGRVYKAALWADKGVWTSGADGLHFTAFDANSTQTAEQLGPFQVTRGEICGGGQGVVCIRGTVSEANRAPAQGVICATADGQFRRLNLPPILARQHPDLRFVSKDLAWARGDEKASCVLLDVKAGKVVDQLPPGSSWDILAAKADATVFVRGADPNSRRLRAFAPRSPEAPTTVRPQGQKTGVDTGP